MHKTQSLSKPGKCTAPKSITVLLTLIGNGWRATGANRTATGRRKALCTFYLTSAGLKALKVFQHTNGSYPGSPGMSSSQTQQLGRHSSSQSSSRRCWTQILKTQLHLKRQSSVASSGQPFAFSFCSSLSKPQDNSFFRSTRPMKVWKCFDGHVSTSFHLLCRSKEGSL